MLGIVRYRAGNLASVSNALDRLGAGYRISDDPSELERCRGILFPGVGHAGAAMEDLRRKELDKWLISTRKPVLGICLGMQLLYEGTEEGETRTLGLFPGRLRRFDPAKGKVPHMGWNRVRHIRPHPILKGIGTDDFFYFVHSYHAPVNETTLSVTEYGLQFASIAANRNFTGVQFHPEKSAGAGRRLLANFLDMISKDTAIQNS